MATNVARATSVVEALINGTASTDQKSRLLAAYALLAPVGSSNEEIAGVFLEQIRHNILGQIKFAERVSALAAADSTVETDFTSAP